MNDAVVLIISGLFGLCTISNGAVFVPNAYTLDGVVAVNGSNADGGCPSKCVGITNSVRRCNCMGTGAEGQTTGHGVLSDNTVPTINPVGNMWASQLLTVMGGANSVMIGVRLDATSSGATLPAREVVIYLFHCHAWGIGAETITVHYSSTFPNFFGVFNIPGSVSLTNIQNCDSLTRVSIPSQPISDVIPNYFLEFHNPSGAVIQWVHIGEVMFSDQPIPVPTTMTPTTTATTLPTSVAETTTNEFSTSTATPLISTMSDLTTEIDSSLFPTTNVMTTEDTQSTTTIISTSDTKEETMTTGAPPPDSQSSFSGTLVGALVGVIVTLLVLLVTVGVVIAVLWRLKVRTGAGEDEDREYDDVVGGSELIETKTNQAYGQVTGGREGRGGGVRMVDNEAYSMSEGATGESEEREYEEIRH